MDVTIENHLSIVMVRPHTHEAREWLDGNTAGMWMGGALACEPRYVDQLIEGLQSDGFEVAAG